MAFVFVHNKTSSKQFTYKFTVIYFMGFLWLQAPIRTRQVGFWCGTRWVFVPDKGAKHLPKSREKLVHEWVQNVIMNPV
jgi:hypothetical protein